PDLSANPAFAQSRIKPQTFCRSRAEKAIHRAASSELEGFQQRRSEPPDGAIFSDQLGSIVRGLRLRQTFCLSYAADELVPSDSVIHRRKGIGLIVSRVDHGAACCGERPEIPLGLA